MMMIRKLLLVTLVVLLSLNGLAKAEESTTYPVRLIPMRDFFKNPEKSGFQLSPDGVHLSWLQPWRNRMNIHVQRIGSAEVIRITDATERDIYSYYWLNNERIGFIQDKGGDENFRAYAVDVDGSDFKDLTPFENVRVRFIDDLEDDDDHILIGLNKRNPRIHDVYRLNVNTGKLKLIAENPGNVAGWSTDNDGQLRIAVTSDGVNSSVLYRSTEKDPWKLLVTTSFKDSFYPLYFTPDNRLMYVGSNLQRDKTAVYRYDPETAETLDLIFEHPEVDVYRLMQSPRTKKITGISYTTDKSHYHFFDEERKKLQDMVEAKLPGYEVSLADMSRDETRVLVRTYSDKSLGAYYYLDRPTGVFQKLVDVSPWIKEEEMADMQPISYTSRDGLTIHGYLTIPRGMDHKKLPVVVNPHGGPWARDHWGFNQQVQFMANRGYAVLQMNFRGSTGYGRSFWTASFKQWGRRMQDDITDGVLWLIKQGTADPERIGIFGASYGGYAVLAGLVYTPSLYACGVDYVGVSNIFTLLDTLPPYWELGRKKMYEMIGHPETEKALLKAASPVFHVHRIKAPLFVAQGANDPRVKKAESDQIVAALKSRGIDVPYMVKDNEGHGFSNEENRFDFWRAMEKFLAKHLGGRAE